MSHDNLIAEFVAITGDSANDANDFLKMQDWKLDAAVNVFLSSNESHPSSKSSNTNGASRHSCHASAGAGAGAGSPFDADFQEPGVPAPRPQLEDQLLTRKCSCILFMCKMPHADGVDPLSGERFGGQLRWIWVVSDFEV